MKVGMDGPLVMSKMLVAGSPKKLGRLVVVVVLARWSGRSSASKVANARPGVQVPR